MESGLLVDGLFRFVDFFFREGDVVEWWMNWSPAGGGGGGGARRWEVGRCLSTVRRIDGCVGGSAP